MVLFRLREGNYSSTGSVSRGAGLLHEELYLSLHICTASVLAEQCVDLCKEMCLAEMMRNQFPSQGLRNH